MDSDRLLLEVCDGRSGRCAPESLRVFTNCSKTDNALGKASTLVSLVDDLHRGSEDDAFYLRICTAGACIHSRYGYIHSEEATPAALKDNVRANALRWTLPRAVI